MVCGIFPKFLYPIPVFEIKHQIVELVHQWIQKQKLNTKITPTTNGLSNIDILRAKKTGWLLSGSCLIFIYRKIMVDHYCLDLDLVFILLDGLKADFGVCNFSFLELIPVTYLGKRSIYE